MAGINYAVSSNWGSGFVADMTVPGGSQGLYGWTIEFEADFDISSIWGATIVSHVGDHYVISNADWNANVAAGNQASFGFQASVGAGGTTVSGLTLDGAGVTPPPPPPPLPTLTIADASVTEGNAGTTQLSFTVTLSQAATAPVTVHYATADGTAKAGSDYATQTGTLSLHSVDTRSPATPTPPSPPTVTSDPNHMFSPYIDMAMSQDDDLLAISQVLGIQDFTLAFMLSSNQGIGWQGQGSITDDTLANGSTILQQVEAIQAMGGNITISFGGAAGQEAALTAPSAATLQAEYQSVIDRYQVNSIDFDIEGTAELDQHSLHLRDQAIVGLQAANPDLKVSFTVPVLPSDLDSGLNVLQTAKNDGVRIDVVYVMAMDYGQGVDNNGQMGQDAISAAIATERQLADMGLVAKIGVTSMIGVNDIASEVFTPADAQSLVDYAKTDSQLALLSMWSVARDNGSGAGSHAAAPDNSGVAQQPYQYAGILHQFDHQS